MYFQNIDRLRSQVFIFTVYYLHALTHIDFLFSARPERIRCLGDLGLAARNAARAPVGLISRCMTSSDFGAVTSERVTAPVDGADFGWLSLTLRPAGGVVARPFCVVRGLGDVAVQKPVAYCAGHYARVRGIDSRGQCFEDGMEVPPVCRSHIGGLARWFVWDGAAVRYRSCWTDSLVTYMRLRSLVLG